jgi:GH24 family phage-related lysozyme (muramidase)
MTVEDLSAKLLLVLEGKRLVSYQDSKGIWTAGIGHTKGVTPGMIVTPDQVRQWFVEDQAPLLEAVSPVQ